MKKTGRKESERTKFCSCKNSCQKGTGRKRRGCPCKDKGEYCSDQCKCGTNVIVCKNNNRCSVQCDDLPKTAPSNMKIVDENDGFISDDESTLKQEVVNDTSVIASNYRKAQHQHSTRRILSQLPSGQRFYQINNGYALVFQNTNFGYHLRKRKGAEKDLDAIKMFCKEAKLTIDVQENVTVSDIRIHCKELTEDGNTFRYHDALVCFILSHGNSSGIHGVEKGIISVKDIVSYFKENDELLGKPKLFFIQACRGKGGQVEDDSTETGERRLCPPESSDTLIAHSTIKGELAYRDTRHGSWFIQTLMKHIKAHGQNSHLMDIMTVVNDDIAGSHLEGYRQMPIQVSTLTKFVYFKMATIPKDEED